MTNPSGDLIIGFLLGLLCITLAQSVCPPNCLANSDCDAEPDGGCPQCTEAYYGRQCQYRMECKYTEKGESYRGLLNTTLTGHACHIWSSRWPGRFHKDNEGNYCRNPDDSSTAWCYSTKFLTRYDFCNIPSCETQCTAPPQPSGSELLNPAKPREGFYDGYTANIRCPGNVNVQSVCRSNTWSPVSCHVIFCENPMLEPNSYITNPQKNYKNGTIVDISCNAGYEIKGNSRLMCLATKTWNGTFPSCTGNYCENPMLEPNSYISNPQKNYKNGTIVDISCNAGYEIKGNSRLMCLATKTWNGTFPSCTETQCTEPPQPPGSELLNPVKQGFYDGYTANIRCPGNVNVQSVCRLNTWSYVSCPGNKSEFNVGAATGIGSAVAVLVIILIIVCVTLKKKGMNKKCSSSEEDRSHYEDYTISSNNEHIYLELNTFQ